MPNYQLSNHLSSKDTFGSSVGLYVAYRFYCINIYNDYASVHYCLNQLD